MSNIENTKINASQIVSTWNSTILGLSTNKGFEILKSLTMELFDSPTNADGMRKTIQAECSFSPVTLKSGKKVHFYLSAEDTKGRKFSADIDRKNDRNGKDYIFLRVSL